MAKNEEMFKSAIAEAKALKTMAIANAKAALEEAFTPQLTTMFSAKIREMEEEKEDELYEDDDINLDEVLNEVEEEEIEDETEDETSEDEEEEKEDDSLNIEDMTKEDLEKLIEDIMLEEFPELSKFKAEDSEDEDSDEEINLEDEVEDEEISLDEILNEMEDDEDDEVNIEEMLNELEEEIDESPVYEELSLELSEAKNTIATLIAERDELMNEVKEVNMLNAKLLYTNKIFKSKNLNESQKVKVLGAFDKTTSVKEVKLVYETLLESLKVKTPTHNQVAGRASKPSITPSKPTQIIESNDQYLRMQKLAGII